MMLAQLSPSALQLASWLGCLFFVLGLVKVAWDIADKVRGRYASSELEKRISHLEIDSQRGNDHRDELAGKVERLLVAVGKLETNDEAQNRDLKSIKETQRDMPGDIIAQLRNSGAIK